MARIVTLLNEGGELDNEQSALAVRVLSKFIDPKTGLDTISFATRGRPRSKRKEVDEKCLVLEIDWRIAEAQAAGSKRARTEVFEQIASEKGVEVETLNKIYRLATKQCAEDDMALAVRLRSAGRRLDEWLELLAHR